jgi:hypothetical protein
MLKRLAVVPHRHLILAALLAAGSWFVLHSQVAEAQQNGVRRSPVIVAPGAFQTRPRVGGYSMTLSEIWGLPEMPPAPKDFGPHFDFPPESLNGPPLHDPYPN